MSDIAQHSQNLSTLDRAISAGLGGFALARYGGRSVLGTILAAGLIQRAATGHCALYQALGIDTKDPTTPTFSRPTVQLSRSVTIRATPEQIFGFFSRDLERMTEISPEVLSLERLTSDLSRWTVQTPVGKHTFESRIVEREPDRHLSWTCEEGRFPHSGEVHLMPGPRGTTVRVNISYQTPGGVPVAQLARLSGHEPHEALQRALYNLQSLLEAGEVPQSMPVTTPPYAINAPEGQLEKEILR